MKSGLATLVWKELLDLSRDTRALALMILIPLVGLPLLAVVAGGLSSAQMITMYVQYNNTPEKAVAEWIAGNVSSMAVSQGIRLYVAVGQGPPNATYDVEVLVPSGFYNNLTSLDREALLVVKEMVGSYAAQEVEGVIMNYLSQLAGYEAKLRVERLAKAANISVNPSYVLNPVVVASSYYLPSGAAASSQQVQLSESVKFLAFSLFFVVDPAIVIMSDSIAGEKERKTLEVLLTSPLEGRSLVLGKLISAAAIGLAIAIADSTGLIIYIFMLAGTSSLALTPELIALNLVVAAILVFMTSTIMLPVVLRSPSVRTAQAASYAIMMVALAIYFSALFVNPSSLPRPIEYAMMAIPFTEAALALTSYAVGQYSMTLLSIAIMLAYAAAFVALSVKLYNPEKLILQR